MENLFCIYDYHFVWYMLGFLFAPRLTLAILTCLYLPVALSIKIIAIILGIITTIKVKIN